ncbi:MAG: fibronectin type III domain-containing protein, partial [Micromonosporaceae bacterium]
MKKLLALFVSLVVLASGAAVAPAGAVPSGPEEAPQGGWVGVYGADGYYLPAFEGASLAGDVDGLTAQGVTFGSTGLTRYRFAALTSDARALESPDQSVRRAAALYTNTTGSATLTFDAAYVGVLHLYVVDWNTTARRQTIDVDDGAVQSIELTSSYNAGAWVHFPIDAAVDETVTITLTNTGASNAVLSGLFLGGDGLTAPGAPAGLVATAGDDSVSLDWGVPVDDGGSAVTGYNVYRALVNTFPGGTPLNGGTPVTESAYVDATAVNATTYFYWVTAVNAIDEGPESASATATPAAPSITTSQEPQGDWVGNWGADGYYLPAFNGTTPAGDVDGLVANGETVGLSGLTRYRFGISAEDRALEAPDQLSRVRSMLYTDTTGSVTVTFDDAYSG